MPQMLKQRVPTNRRTWNMEIKESDFFVLIQKHLWTEEIREEYKEGNFFGFLGVKNMGVRARLNCVYMCLFSKVPHTAHSTDSTVPLLLLLFHLYSHRSYREC